MITENTIDVVPQCEILRLPHCCNLPEYATVDSAGMDIFAANFGEIVLPPLGRALIPAGISIALPRGYEAQVRPRSGIALKNGITVLNTPGTIDADYRGEIGIILMNLGNETFTITRGMKIAQLVISRYEKISWQLVDILPQTVRGSGGFGSTGLGSYPHTASTTF